MTDENRDSPAQTVSHAEMTGNERFLLGWLYEENGQYGECVGPSLDALIAKGFVVVGGEETGTHNSFIAKGRDIMFRAVSITEAGRAALQPKREPLTAYQRSSLNQAGMEGRKDV